MPPPVPMSLSERLLRAYVDGIETCGCDMVDSNAPGLLLYWPHAKMNKYQALLYTQASRCGFVTLPLTQLEQLDDVSWPGDIVFHAHWFASLHNEAKSEDEAIAANEAAFKRLTEFRTRTGAHLIWTAHNLFPHGDKFPRASLDLRRRIADKFDLIHLMDANHGAILTSAYGLPPRQTFTVPHMTYCGVYADYLSREEARATLAIPAKSVVFIFFGSIQQYKGLEFLVQTFKELLSSGRRDARLLIAGFPSDTETLARIKDLAANEQRIIIDGRRIADDEVQFYCKSADAMVLPYADTLNSGAAALAVTFGLPIIAPRALPFLPYSKLGAQMYDPTAPDALLEALMSFHDHLIADPQPSSNALEAPKYLHPKAISMNLFELVRRHLNLDRKPIELNASVD